MRQSIRVGAKVAAEVLLSMKTQSEIDEIHRRASEISLSNNTKFQKNKIAYKDYDRYRDVLCVFQTHNKAHLLKEVLSPFLKNEFKNIVFFADGCQDNTLAEASSMLNGKYHVVIRVNDLHEITNYRTAINSEWARDCKYMLLIQDDDIYPDDFSWLDEAMSIMEKDEKLVVIGFNLGVNYSFINPASATFEIDNFHSFSDGRFGLPGSYEATLPVFGVQDVRHIAGVRIAFRYCDCVNRAPNLIKIAEFRNATSFDKEFEPYFDDDTNYCLDLWSKGFRVGYLVGVPIYRDIGIGGMRLNDHVSRNKRPWHAKRNHNYIYERYGELINSGRLRAMVESANKTIST